MAKDENEKIERTRKRLLVEFKDSWRVERELEELRKERRKAAKALKKDNLKLKNKIHAHILQYLIPHPERGSKWAENSWHLSLLSADEGYSKEYIGFIRDAYEINHYISPKFISDTGNYFKHPSNKNLEKIQPEFKRIMSIRNQEKLLKRELFKSLIFQRMLHSYRNSYRPKNKKPIVYELDKSLMYNRESQVKAYSEAVESNKEYNKGLEDILLAQIIPAICAEPPGDSYILTETTPFYQKLNIIALGCGSGIHEYEFASKFIKQRKLNEEKVMLYLTDVNQAMVDEAVANAESRNFKSINEEKKPINTIGLQLDFLKDIDTHFNKMWDLRDNHLFLFLGTTLGNFCKADQEKIFQNVCRSMHYMDNFVVGVKGMHYSNGKPDKEKMKQEYRLTEDFAYKPFEILGIERMCLGDYKVDFRKHMVPEIKCYFPVIQDTEIQLNHEKIKFYKGDKIYVINSQRFTNEALNDLACSTKKGKDEAKKPYEGYLKTVDIAEKEGYKIALFIKKDYDDDIFRADNSS